MRGAERRFGAVSPAFFETNPHACGNRQPNVKIRFDIDQIDLKTPARDQPRYSIADASGYLNVPKATLSSWFYGTTYGKGGSRSNFDPVLDPASLEPRLLSFDNLAEAFVLRMFRTKDKIQLRTIGLAIQNARDRLGIEKPLLHENLFRGGKDLFLETAGQITGLTDPVQLLLPHWESFLERVHYRDKAVAAIYPLTRPVETESPSIVSISPDFSFGSSVIDRTKVRTSVIAERYIGGDSVIQIANDFRCKSEEVEEAIRAEWMFSNAQQKQAA